MAAVPARVHRESGRAPAVGCRVGQARDIDAVYVRTTLHQTSASTTRAEPSGVTDSMGETRSNMAALLESGLARAAAWLVGDGGSALGAEPRPLLCQPTVLLALGRNMSPNTGLSDESSTALIVPVVTL
jgi:hypothetical protein